MRKLFNDEAGFIVSAELVLVLTIAVLAMAVGLASVRDAINNELVDLSSAFGTIDQSYNVTGNSKARTGGNAAHASTTGFGFNDQSDNCDCKALTISEVCGKTDASGTGTGEGN